MKLYLSATVLLAASLAQPAFAGPADSAAAQRVKQIRQDVEAKQQELAAEKRADVPAPAAPAAPLALPIDETDSPGATQK